jgi:hypothetical protein
LVLGNISSRAFQKPIAPSAAWQAIAKKSAEKADGNLWGDGQTTVPETDQ